MPVLRRGQGNNEEGDYLRATLGPAPTAWDQEYPLTHEGALKPFRGSPPGDHPSHDDQGDLPRDAFSITTIAPQGDDPGEQAITREQYYRLRETPI